MSIAVPIARQKYDRGEEQVFRDTFRRNFEQLQAKFELLFNSSFSSRRVSQVNPGSGTTITVTLDPEEIDATYKVICGGDENRNYWITGRTVSGFTINTDVAFAGTGNTWWFLFR